MSSIVNELYTKNIVKMPSFVSTTHYEVIMGSYAYGVSDDMSDVDIYGFTIPPKDYIFPHIRGEILGFGKPGPRFEQWQQHHIQYREREYDCSIFNIVKYFQLAMENNPNLLDSLFVSQRCVLHSTKVGDIIRDERHSFLHKGAYHKLMGYAHSQMQKAKTKVYKILYEQLCNFYSTDLHLEEFYLHLSEYLKNKDNDFGYSTEIITNLRKIDTLPNIKRVKSIIDYGYDVKFLYHLARLSDQAEQLLTLGTMDLERSKEYLKAIRRGEIPFEEVEALFKTKELALSKIYNETTIIPYSANEEKIKKLLLHCIEEYYGNLSSFGIVSSKSEDLIRDIRDLISKAGY